MNEVIECANIERPPRLAYCFGPAPAFDARVPRPAATITAAIFKSRLLARQKRYRELFVHTKQIR